MDTDQITVESVKKLFPEADILDDEILEEEVVGPARKINSGREKIDDIEDLLYQAFEAHGWAEGP